MASYISASVLNSECFTYKKFLVLSVLFYLSMLYVVRPGLWSIGIGVCLDVVGCVTLIKVVI